MTQYFTAFVSVAGKQDALTNTQKGNNSTTGRSSQRPAASEQEIKKQQLSSYKTPPSAERRGSGQSAALCCSSSVKGHGEDTEGGLKAEQTPPLVVHTAFMNQEGTLVAPHSCPYYPLLHQLDPMRASSKTLTFFAGLCLAAVGVSLRVSLGVGQYRVFLVPASVLMLSRVFGDS